MNLFVLTCRDFGLLLLKVTPGLYFLFIIYLQNRVLLTVHGPTGCDTTSKVVINIIKKVFKEEIKGTCSLLH